MTHRDDSKGLLYYRCARCAAAGYLPRDFCGHCGHKQREAHRAVGIATVVAATELPHHDNNDNRPALGVCLLAFDEGFRAMARSVTRLAPGTRAIVTAIDDGIASVEPAENGTARQYPYDPRGAG